MRKVVLLLVLAGGACLGRQAPKEEGPIYTVKIRASLPNVYDDVIRSSLQKELRKSSDVSIVPEDSKNPLFSLNVVCIAKEAVRQLICAEVGFLPTGDDSKGGWQVGALISQAVISGSLNDIPELCARVVAEFEQACIEPWREAMAEGDSRH